MNTVAPEMLALRRLYYWEKIASDRIALTQPMGGGAIQDYTWRQVADQVRRVAPTCNPGAGRRARMSPSCPRTAPGGS